MWLQPWEECFVCLKCDAEQTLDHQNIPRIGSCECDGPQWSGPLCDKCADGFDGEECRRTVPPGRRTTTPPRRTPTPTTIPARPRTTRPTPSGTSKGINIFANHIAMELCFQGSVTQRSEVHGSGVPHKNATNAAKWCTALHSLIYHRQTNS